MIRTLSVPVLLLAASGAASAQQTNPLPGNVLDLKVVQTTETSVRLGWTAVGIDGTTGTGASIYHIMVGLVPVTQWTWDHYLPQMWFFPPPAPAPGTWLEWELEELTPGWMIYVSVKASQTSPYQTSAEFVSIPAEHDIVPPDPVTGLSATPDGPTRLVVRWIDAADDGILGRAVEHDLRVADEPFTPERWEGADRLGAPSPSYPGTERSLLLAGLDEGQTLHFAMKSRDAMGNWTETFVTAVGTTLPPDGISHGAGDAPCSGGAAPALAPLAALALLLRLLRR